jgi:hypothetical protein
MLSGLLKGRRKLWLALGAMTLAGLLLGGATFAAFRATTSNSSNSFASAADFEAPTIVRSTVKKTTGYSAGRIKQNQAYYAYAQVTDGGNPSSGISTVTANLAVASNVISAGKTAVTMCTTGGPWTVAGLSYNYRTTDGTCAAGTSLTSDNPLTAGSKNYTITGTDVAGNSSGAQTYSVTVDNTAPTASDVDTTNGGSIVGRPEQNDTIAYTFSEAMDPDSLLTGWDGASAANVVVRFDNNAACTGGSTDRVTIYDSTNATQLNFGCVKFTGNFVTASRTFGASGTASSMVMSGSVVTITLGTQSGAGATSAASQTDTWVPSASAFDLAGNAMSTTSASRTEVAW